MEFDFWGFIKDLMAWIFVVVIVIGGSAVGLLWFFAKMMSPKG